MRKELLLLLSMIVVGCTTVEDSFRILEKAKQNKKQTVCQLVKTPKEVRGVYCVKFEGPASIVEN